MLLAVVFISGCKEDDETPVLSVSGSDITVPTGGSTPQINISELGGTSEITISCNEKWRISNSAEWLGISQSSGEPGTSTVELNAGGNTTGIRRTAMLTVSADNGQSRRLVVSQASELYPSYNLSPKPPDETGMSSTAVELAAKMTMGINFGNTMEAPTEALWVTSKITESYVKFVKQSGFNAVRIPCTWSSNHSIDPEKAKIDPVWLNRVKEVVGWCVDNDMYVMLNIHGDGRWLDDHINKAGQDAVNAKQKALWEQIATTMRDFDEHLMFASANEPPVENAEQMSILNGYHETFIKTVRATGGRNSYRVLVVQGPSTDPTKTYDLMNTLPTDNIPNKLMVEVHDYTPFQFTQLTGGNATWGNMFYYWGKGNHSTIEPERNATHGEEDVIDSEFQKIKQKFVDKGIPVILGEYAAWRRNAINNADYLPKDLDKHNKSVNDWTYYVTKQARVNGIMPFYWEIGFMLDRSNNTVKDQPMLDALIEAYK
ncbi:cellulase family glycosylhydrolase [Ohtaekwangia koreensis]|nr:cellulase family glycosylhydrolase [Ohtaekwangia koreensis]